MVLVEVSVCKKKERADRFQIIAILPSFPADLQLGFLLFFSATEQGVGS
jgi:hypothetical protein